MHRKARSVDTSELFAEETGTDMVQVTPLLGELWRFLPNPTALVAVGKGMRAVKL